MDFDPVSGGLAGQVDVMTTGRATPICMQQNPSGR
jgi:hypothetical protein